MKKQRGLQILIFYLLTVGICISMAGPITGSDCKDSDCKIDTGQKLDGRLGLSAWSFQLFTFFDAVDKTKALELKYIEAYEGQNLDKNSSIKLSRSLSDEAIQKICRKLDEADVTLTSIYIGKVPGDEAGCREVFEFARKLGVKAIISEPAPKDLDTIEKLCDEYAINLALHNHPQGTSLYWHPKEVLKVCKGRSKRIGACGDFGHWQRSGIKPADGVRILGKRLLSVHVKDLNEFGNSKAHDVPWGTGQGELEEALREIDRLGIQPAIFGIEYEYNWKNSMPEIAECVKFFRAFQQKQLATDGQ